ncbi:beta-lactamase family protein [candidate division KSB1 bacterium]|nr:beta-lactamase family protein [candidate division KSB1 bacterium]
MKLQQLIDKTVNNKKVIGVVVSVHSGSESWTGSSGNLTNESQYFIASATKLYTTAIIMKLREDGRLRLEDKISAYLEPGLLKNLHIYKGVDYSDSLTIKHLLAQNSGLPDYFEGEDADGNSLKDELLLGKDRKWGCEEAVEISKKMKSRFPPGKQGKAFYSDTNFQLLGRIIEIVTGKTYARALAEHIFVPLNLEQTYLFQDSSDTRPVSLYYRTAPLAIPLAMTSFGPDGGIVSTAGESMIFLKAFFRGKLFPAAYLAEMQHWNKIFFPLQYGVGIMKFKLPWFFSPFKSFPELIGHSGLSGAFAYYCPAKNIFLTGTVNQVAHSDISYKLMIKISSKL